MSAATEAAAPLIDLQDVAIDYVVGRRSFPAVRGVTLRVAAGETVAIVGESGSGKTTTANAVVGLLPARARLVGGRVVVAGHEVDPRRPRSYRGIRGRVVGLVPQDPLVGLNPTLRVGFQIAEAVRIGEPGLSRGAVGERVLELLARVGLDRPEARAQQYAHELSGGMRQRVLIAIALASRPKVIIADEPTSALDVTVQRRILDHLASLVREDGIALVIITHDLAVAVERTERIIVMQQGRIVDEGPSEQILEAPAAGYTRRLIAAAPAFRAAPGAGDGSDPAPDSDLVRWIGVTRRFSLPGSRERLTALDDVTVTAHRHRTLAVVGESGSGKTTLIRSALGLVRPDSGTIVFDGTDVASASRGTVRSLRRRIQLVQQNPFASLNPRWTVGQSIAEPLRGFGTAGRRENGRRVRAVLDEVQLPSSYLDRYPSELSGGQRQRVAIARAVALEPDVVLLDEPVSALDVSVQAQVLDLLARLQREHGTTFVLVSHDLAVVAEIAHDVAVLQAGRVVETGRVAAVFSSPQEEYTRRLLAAVPGRDAARRLRERGSARGTAVEG